MTTVLIVEDNEVNRELMETVLGAEGFSTRSIENGSGIIEAAADVALVLMDINMPEVDGFMALDALRSNEATASIPVVAVTGNAIPADREKMVSRGFDEILIKPFHIIELIEVTRRYT